MTESKITQLTIDLQVPIYYRECSCCKTTKPSNAFYKNKGSKDGLHTWCKDCHNRNDRRDKARKTRKRWKDRNREKLAAQYREYGKTPEYKAVARKRKIKTLYGITIEEYEGLLLRQDGKCAICGRPPKTKRLNIDHCHVSNKVRGLLCSGCNRALGQLGDNEQGVMRVIQYLRSCI